VENPGEREPRDMAYPKEYGESGKHWRLFCHYGNIEFTMILSLVIKFSVQLTLGMSILLGQKNTGKW
jgi:hypothetical protein